MNEENQKFYLKEYSYYDGECFITFNLLGINFDLNLVSIAVTNRGRISVIEYDLFQDSNGDFYFEYGVMLEKIYLENFETIGEF